MLQLLIDNIDDLLYDIEDKDLICYGCGENFNNVMNKYSSYNLSDKVKFIVDSDSTKWNSEKTYEENKYPICSFYDFVEYAKNHKIVILITNRYNFIEIINKLDECEILDGIHAYVGSFLHIKYRKNNDYVTIEPSKPIIPKTIHYCWFGGAPIPEEYKKYIESWKKYCPDYDIIRWDESNYDVTKNKYMYQAYKAKKWAFVSDYARLDIIYNHGGIYLDTDVELLKSLDDLLGCEFYAGFEDMSHIALGLGYGSVKFHPILRKMLDFYSDLEFITDDGYNLTPCPIYQSEVIKAEGFVMDNTYQENNGIILYPSNFFSPISYYGMGEINENTYSVHHYTASWHSEEQKERRGKNKMLEQVLYQRFQKNSL